MQRAQHSGDKRQQHGDDGDDVGPADAHIRLLTRGEDHDTNEDE